MTDDGVYYLAHELPAGLHCLRQGLVVVGDGNDRAMAAGIDHDAQETVEAGTGQVHRKAVEGTGLAPKRSVEGTSLAHKRIVEGDGFGHEKAAEGHCFARKTAGGGVELAPDVSGP